MVLKNKNIACRLLLVLFIAGAGSSPMLAQQPAPLVWDTLVKGHFFKDEVRKTVLYVPVRVPDSVSAFNMQAIISAPADNVLDIGVFDERGTGPGPANGFRGWAGGVSSKQVHITKAGATPSYIPGPIHKGIWNIILVPTSIKKEGFDWQLKISLEKAADTAVAFIPHPAREYINNKKGWYRGDLHMHDVNSDGSYTQAELVQDSKAAGLDFMIPTNHNTNAANLNWGRYDDSTILILNGEEVTPFLENHWNAIGINPDTWIEWRYDAASRAISQYQRQVHAAGGLSVINHPFYDTDSIVDTRFPVNGFDAIEVWNGPWDRRDEYGVGWWDAFLKKGIRKTAIGASDTHRPGSENSIAHPQTVVHAGGLNRKAIIEGLRRGSCYIAADTGISISFLAKDAAGRKATIGDTLKLKEKDKLKTVIILKGIAGNSRVILISNTGIQQVFDSIPGNTAKLSCSLPAKGMHYLRMECRRADGTMQALSNPIWITTIRQL